MHAALVFKGGLASSSGASRPQIPLEPLLDGSSLVKMKTFFSESVSRTQKILAELTQEGGVDMSKVCFIPWNME